MKDPNDLPPSQAGRGEPLPLAQAARCLHKTNRLSPSGLTPETEALARELEESFNAGLDDEMMLYTHARILDAMFKHYMTEEIHKEAVRWQTGEKYTYISSDELATALRLQQHARTTLRALALTRKNKAKKKDDWF